MNEVAYRENQENAKHTRAYDRNGVKVLEVDSRKVTYNGRKYHELMVHEKRKLENKILLGDTDRVKKLVRFI